jgi:hypothetical protein
MKLLLSALTSALLVVTFLSPLVFAELASTIDDGPSARGKFEILPLEGIRSRSIEFHAETTADGRTIGEAIYQDNSQANPQSSADTARENPLYLRADLDCLMVKANKAIMGGSITQSNVDNYLGRRFLIVVQDNGATENPLKHDKLTWGVYRTGSKPWIATDAERPDETGPLSWMATDAERPEDPGAFPDNTDVVGCKTFPVSSFSFLDIAHSRGSVRVKP